MIQKCANILEVNVFLPADDQDGALGRGRQHPVQFYGGGGSFPNALQAGCGKYGSLPMAFRHLAEAGIDISSQIFYPVCRVFMQPLGLTAQATGGDGGDA